MLYKPFEKKEMGMLGFEPKSGGLFLKAIALTDQGFNHHHGFP